LTGQIGTGLAVSSTDVQSRAIARWHLHLRPRHAVQIDGKWVYRKATAEEEADGLSLEAR